ncbi:hypothetical protein N0V93_004520 [Gnomoniopsis smithogilvyi]|uniref:Cytochrome P450 n=1 Tax=Gnomoniopsis smithogilvyi TaxID=1191159 RepID=A0A9W9CX98_9PEZI|nr:hypothetical protein N0V93_004520 [Gnomoniopsis smithogilvyi]
MVLYTPDSGHQLVVYPVAIIAIYITTQIVYNLFFHPLRNFPGPRLWRAFRLPYVLKAVQGKLATDMLAIHEKYGPIVRVAPNELAISHESAWRDIMTGGKELPKWAEYYKVQEPQPTYIMSAPDDEHAVIRRSLGSGFSDKSMRNMEPIIQRYITKFTNCLRQKCERRQSEANGEGNTAVLDLHEWFNFLAFDLIGDLALGKSYDCLEKGVYNPWVAPIFEVTHISAIMSSLGHYPWLKGTLLYVFRRLIETKMRDHQGHTRTKLNARMALQRSDLIESLVKIMSNDEQSKERLNLNASVLVVAGAETSATTLSAVTYFLLSNPSKMSKLLAEIRSTFKNEEDITIATVSRLEYMLACLDEAMRLFPPVAIGLPRVVPNGGRSISGFFIPEQTHVAIWHWALYRDPGQFTKPSSFCPERFMGDPEFSSDNLDAFQPFHLGKRSCVGRPLAYVEMRLILARLLFNFDLRLEDESRDWISRSVPYNIWWKPPLRVSISIRQSDV